MMDYLRTKLKSFLSSSTDYTILNYLQGTGTQYINTRITPRPGIGLYQKCTRDNTADESPLGCYNSARRLYGFTEYGGVLTIGYFNYSQINQSNYMFQTTNTDALSYITGTVYEGWINYKNDDILKVYSEENGYDFTIPKSATSCGTFAAGEVASIAMFGCYQSSGRLKPCCCKIYRLTFTIGTDIVRDFIPVLDSSGVPAMYDLIRKEYFYNQGTGEFLYG